MVDESSQRPNPAQLAKDLRLGDRRALARAITLVESTQHEHREDALTMLEALAPSTGQSLRIAVTGVPGVGKSTFIEALGLQVLDHSSGVERLAVLSVDPSSAVSGGSILGDKTRMPALAQHPRAYLRPSPSGGALGGVARRTSEAILVCEAAGFDLIIVETVGVGQSETAVTEMTDLMVLLLVPGGGDELQGIKRGIVELADVVLVNKADGALEDAAIKAAAEYASALGFLRPNVVAPSTWKVPVLTCSARNGLGIHEAWSVIRRWQEESQLRAEVDRRRRLQVEARMWREASDLVVVRLRADPGVGAAVDTLHAEVVAGRVPASVAAKRLIDLFLSGV